MVRYEFMEILVRIAHDRFVRNKICTNVADALQKLFRDHILKFMMSMDTNKWRKEMYVCEEVDLVLKAHKLILDVIFKKYSGKKTLPGKKAFMCLDEFRNLCNDAGLVNDHFASREIDSCFALAMMTQVDELNMKKHIEMSFVEFLEAICRAFDLSNSALINYTEKEQEKHLFDTNSTISLSKKVEAGLQNFVRCCPDSIKDSFNYPTQETYRKMMYRSKTRNLTRSLTRSQTIISSK